MIENRMAVEGQREDYEAQGIWDSPLFDDCTTFCEIYGCKECPRYGDDCDGDGTVEDDEDDRVAYYEKQGDEYVYYDENECELYREPA